MSDHHVINSRLPRLDAPAKATGRAVFIDDMTFPGMLHAALLQSPLPHARILRIDTSKAERLPGVKAVITSKDAGLVRYGVSPARYDETVFCHDRVRYVGEAGGAEEELARRAGIPFSAIEANPNETVRFAVCIKRDGMETGVNIEATRALAEAVRVPVIASGGVGTLEHLYEGLVDGRADAVLAASIFHFREHTVLDAKRYLATKGVSVRM